MVTEILIFSDPQELARAAADQVIAAAQFAIQEKGRFSLCLSGGNTPRLLYSVLASSGYIEKIDWASVDLFWGDERCVPPEHPDSDYRMARESLLDHIPNGQTPRIYRFMGEIEPNAAAASYEALLRGYFSKNVEVGFDLLLLGMGEDGHTASLFPGTAPIFELNRVAVAHYVVNLSAWRLTLTPAVLNLSSWVMFLATGTAKRALLQEVLHGPYDPDRLPSQIIRPIHENLTWYIDRAAAGD